MLRVYATFFNDIFPYWCIEAPGYRTVRVDVKDENQRWLGIEFPEALEVFAARNQVTLRLEHGDPISESEGSDWTQFVVECEIANA